MKCKQSTASLVNAPQSMHVPADVAILRASVTVTAQRCD